MKPVPLRFVLGALMALPGAAAAAPASASLSPFTPKVMPVLVQVNSHGKVTSASPAMELTPRLSRLLHANLGEMISGPATDKHGRPISSQFVINLVLNGSPRANGNYDAQFAYVSAAPVPPGSWYWVHIDGRRVALAERNAPEFRSHPVRNHRPYYRPAYRPGHDRSPMPQVNRNPAPTPAAQPRHNR